MRGEAPGLKLELCGKEYKLARGDVPEILEGLAKERVPDLGAALVLGGWTGEPPCGLRRSREAVSASFADHPALREEVEDALGRQVACARAEGTNRHAHCLANIYPGPSGLEPGLRRKPDRRGGDDDEGEALEGLRGADAAVHGVCGGDQGAAAGAPEREEPGRNEDDPPL